MSKYPIINIEPELVRIKNRDEEIQKKLRHQTEKHDHQNILKSPKNDKNILRRNVKV